MLVDRGFGYDCDSSNDESFYDSNSEDDSSNNGTYLKSRLQQQKQRIQISVLYEKMGSPPSSEWYGKDGVIQAIGDRLGFKTPRKNWLRMVLNVIKDCRRDRVYSPLRKQ